MPEHPLLHAGAGRFWKPPRERSASSTQIPASAKYFEVNPSERISGSDAASMDGLDPLLPKDEVASRVSFSQSLFSDSSDRLARTASIASGSSSASGGSRYDQFSASALSLPSASSLDIPGISQRLDRSSLANKIRHDERQEKLRSHIRGLHNDAPLGQGAASPSKLSTSMVSSARQDRDEGSLRSISTHRPSISDVVPSDMPTSKRNSAASSDTKRSFTTLKSGGSTESLPAFLRLSKPADESRHLRSSVGPNPLLHLETPAAELDPKDVRKTQGGRDEQTKSRNSISNWAELDTLKSPTELHAEDAPWSRTPSQVELSTSKSVTKPRSVPSVLRKPIAPISRPDSADAIIELPSQPKSPTWSSPTRDGIRSERRPNIKITAENSQRSKSQALSPNPELFQPSKSAEMLGLIPPQLPRRAAPVPLPASNTFELSSSPSVVYRPRSKSADRRPRRRSPANPEAYNTVLHAPFPLLPKEEEEEEPEAETEKGDGKADNRNELKPVDTAKSSHRRISAAEYLGEELSPRISIEPDIDPRTGRPWARLS